jgi:4-hydroxy-2-oxoheptanedioate aldolase
MPAQSFRDRLLNGETLIGPFQMIDSPAVAEIAGIAGYDFTILDQEHGPLTAETTLGLCAAAERGGASPVVRVRANDPPEIQRALDVGADAVEIPQIESLADAEAAVSAARFDPRGDRGLSPYVRAGGYKGGAEYTDKQNEHVTVIVHVEGQAGVEAYDDIVAVEGLDVVFLGPYDLSQSLGIPGQVHDDRVTEQMEDLCDRAEAAGTVVGTYADDPAMANRWIDAGAQFVAIYVDAPTLVGAYRDTIDAVDR